MSEFGKITIVGLGLIGGSLAFALKRSGSVGEVCGVDVNKDALNYALDNGIIDLGSTDLEYSVSNSDIVVISTYVSAIPGILKQISKVVAEDTVVTDVGSVKAMVVKNAEDILHGGTNFVGGHPISGTENSGVQYSRHDLFKGKNCILTPTTRTSGSALEKIKNLWTMADANVIEMDPELHDYVFAFVSHLPHVIAYSLINSFIAEDDCEDLLRFSGGSLRDYTRIASSSPGMWRDTFSSNKDNILKAISVFKSSLSEMEAAIRNDDRSLLENVIKKAYKARRDNVK